MKACPAPGRTSSPTPASMALPLATSALLCATLAFLLLASASPLAAQPPSSKVAYLIDYASQTLDGVDLESGSVHLGLASVGAIPNQLRIVGTQALVVNSLPENLQIIDLYGAPGGTVDLGVGSNPWAVAVVGGKAFVSLWGGDALAVVDLAGPTLTGWIEVGVAPEGMCVAGEYLIVANSGFLGPGMYAPGSVSVIDPVGEQVIHSIPVGLNPQWCATDAEGEAYVVCSGDYGTGAGQVYVIDPVLGTAVDSLHVGGFPGPIAVAASGVAYMVEYGLGLLAIDTIHNTVLHDAGNPIPVGGIGALGLAIDDGDRIHVALSFDGLLTVIDAGGTVVNAYAVGTAPQDVDLYEATPTHVARPVARSAPGLRAARARPNPAGRGAADVILAFQLARAGAVGARIVDVAGRPVRLLPTRELQAGHHRWRWDGRNARGVPVPAGVYFAQIFADGATATVKMTWVH